jgi:hypothetical protein
MSMSRILATAIAAAFSLVSVSPVLAQATPPTPPTPQTAPGSQPSDMSKTPEPSMSESGQKVKAKHDAKKKSVKKAPKKSHETKEPASTEQGSGTTKQ